MDGVWPTVIICAVLALIAALASRSYVKKLRNGCCGAGGDSEKRLRPPDRELSHYPYAWRIKIDGMSCKRCALRIENAFHEKDGFYAKVSLKNKEAIVFTKSKASRQELTGIVERAGYRLLSLEQAAER